MLDPQTPRYMVSLSALQAAPCVGPTYPILEVLEIGWLLIQDRLAGWLAGWLAVWLAGWQGSWLAGWLAGWLAS